MSSWSDWLMWNSISTSISVKSMFQTLALLELHVHRGYRSKFGVYGFDSVSARRTQDARKFVSERNPLAWHVLTENGRGSRWRPRPALKMRWPDCGRADNWLEGTHRTYEWTCQVWEVHEHLNPSTVDTKIHKTRRKSLSPLLSKMDRTHGTSPPLPHYDCLCHGTRAAPLRGGSGTTETLTSFTRSLVQYGMAQVGQRRRGTRKRNDGRVGGRMCCGRQRTGRRNDASAAQRVQFLSWSLSGTSQTSSSCSNFTTW